MAQNLLKNPSRKDYKMIGAITFICGALAYVFMSYGSYGITDNI